MSTFKTAITTVVNIFSKQFYFLSALASIIALVIIFVKESWAVLVALSFFCILLLVFTGYLIYSLLRILEVKNTEHQNRSSFVKYESVDGNKIIYETYKLIQNKKPILTEFEYHFKWSGTHLPVIASNLQNVVNIVDIKDPTKYDRALLKFKKPLYYNENCVIHFMATLDDTDNKSSPHVETRVVDEIDIIHYRIILRGKSEEYNNNAVLQRKKIDSNTSSTFSELLQIPFDQSTKSYEYHLLKPEIGYFYRISWLVN